jgi:predicted nucleic acid-binding protein
LTVGVYLDANVLIGLFFPDDPLHSRAYAVLEARDPSFIVSDLTTAEFAAVVSRQVRGRHITAIKAREVFSVFDSWVGTATERALLHSQDVRIAESFLRRPDLNLRTPDAIHLAASQRLRAELATFDKALVSAARVLKIPLASA